MKSFDKISMTIHDMGITGVIYTPAEFAEKLGVSLQSVNRWDRQGVLRAFRKNNNNRVYKYYTIEQYIDFIKSDQYLNLNCVKNRDLIGERFGKLDIVGFSESAIAKGYYGSYVCHCDCGNVVELPRSELLRHKHKSCGCKFHDLTGKTFNRWHVDSIAPCTYTPGGSKLFQYYCTCECGTKRVVTARSLTSGRSQSCGCWHKDLLSDLFLNDLTGKVFGDLTVRSRAETYKSPSGKSVRTMWNCVCKCGAFIKVSSDNLLSGRIDSCGHDIQSNQRGASKYEFHVRQYLDSIGLFEGDNYVQYKTFPDLVGVGGGYLLYDFFINYNGKLWLIECQGEQHYKPVAWFGGQIGFEKQVEHDRRKREYAKKIGIPLIEIPYTCVKYSDIVSILQGAGIT